MRFLTITLILGIFLLSGNLLTVMGIGYSADGSNVLIKMHPTLYLAAFLALASLYTGRGIAFLKFHKCLRSYFFLLLTLGIAFAVSVARSVFGSSPGGEYYIIFTTLLLPLLAFISLSWLTKSDFRRVLFALRAIIAASSLVGIAERVFDISVLPRLISGEVMEYGWRAVGLMGHPLTSASVAGLALLYLILSPRGSIITKLPEIIIHVLALFCFAGRSALVGCAVLIALRGILLIAGALLNRDLRLLPRFALLGVAAALLLPLALNLDFLAKGFERFQGIDGGSANVRLRTLDMLGSLDSADIWLGMGLAQRTSIMTSFDVPTIENAWLMWMLIFGLILATLILIALVIFCVRLTASLQSPAGYMFTFFFIVATTSISVGSKSLLLSYTLLFVFVTCVDLGRVAAPARRRAVRRPAAALLR